MRQLQANEEEICTGGRISKAKLFKDGTIISLVEFATSTLASLAHIDIDGRGELDSKCLKIVRNLFQSFRHRSLHRHAELNIVKSGFIHSGVVISLDNYDEQMVLLN